VTPSYLIYLIQSDSIARATAALIRRDWPQAANEIVGDNSVSSQ
jgi:hypothetical protein